jgi:NADH/F420H2 dehydrogenase subunit C
MTRALSGEAVARRINEAHPDAVVHHNDSDVWIRPETILDVFKFLNSDSELDFAFLNAVTAVDYVEYFELVYHLLSMRNNTSAVIKSKIFGREELSVPSVFSIWQGADLQEREIWDLMGIRFDGHPNMKRVLLWEGFPGHPLRKDYLG